MVIRGLDRAFRAMASGSIIWDGERPDEPL